MPGSRFASRESGSAVQDTELHHHHVTGHGDYGEGAVITTYHTDNRNDSARSRSHGGGRLDI